MKIYIPMIILLTLFLSGCSEDTTILKKDYNSYSYYTNDLSCSEYLGNELTGSSGDTNRLLNVSNFPLIIVIDTFFLNKDYDYNLTSIGTVYTINFLNNIWDDQEIGICLASGNSTLTNSVYLGINCTDSDGDTNRILDTNISYPLLVSVDNWLLTSGYDYNTSDGNITFFNPLYDTQVISVWG